MTTTPCYLVRIDPLVAVMKEGDEQIVVVLDAHQAIGLADELVQIAAVRQSLVAKLSAELAVKVEQIDAEAFGRWAARQERSEP